MNAIVRVKNRPKKAIDERKVPTVRKEVKIAQPMKSDILAKFWGTNR